MEKKSEVKNQEKKEETVDEKAKAAEVADESVKMSEKTEVETEKKKEGGKPWFMSGADAQEEAKKEYAANKRQPFRLWYRPEEGGEIIFLDDEGFAFWEHELKIGGKYGNYVTCLKGVDPKGCPICTHMGRGNRYIIAMRTIIDLRGYKTKDGVEREWGLKLFAAKDNINKMIERKRKTRGSLVGAKYIVTRTSAKSARCGDDFEFIEEADLDQFIYKDRQGNMVKPAPYDYATIFKPLDYDTVKGFILESEMSNETAEDTDDIAF